MTTSSLRVETLVARTANVQRGPLVISDLFGFRLHNPAALRIAETLFELPLTLCCCRLAYGFTFHGTCPLSKC